MWDIIEGLYTAALPRLRTVRFFILALFGRLFHRNLQSFVQRRHVGALPRGTKMEILIMG